MTDSPFNATVFEKQIDLNPPPDAAKKRFLAMLDTIRKTFPELAEKAVQHAGNKISNELRRGQFTPYAIEIRRSPMDDEGQYVHFEVEASGITVYVRVTVD